MHTANWDTSVDLKVGPYKYHLFGTQRGLTQLTHTEDGLTRFVTIGWPVHQTHCVSLIRVLCQGKRVAVVGTGASAIQVRHSSPIPTSCRVTLSHICSHDALPSFNPPLHISRLHSTQLDD